MILCDIFSGDGVESMWFFASPPREGEYVMLRELNADGSVWAGSYRVTRVVHWPTNVTMDMEQISPMDRRSSMKIYVVREGQFAGHPPGWHGDTGPAAQTPHPAGPAPGKPQ